MTKNLVMNSRVLRQNITGVERYAYEMSKMEGMSLVGPRKERDGFVGHLWEQVCLPAAVCKRTLFSPSNTGPLSVADQIVTIHDMFVFTHPEWHDSKFRHWYQFLLPRLAKKSKKIITVSQYSAELIIKYCAVKESKVHIIPNGVSEEFFLDYKNPHEMKNVMSKYGIDPNIPYYLSVGASSKRKNNESLISAWIRADLKDYQLIIAGSVDKEIKRKIESAGHSNIKLIGYVEDEDLPLVYKNAHCFVHLSLEEGFGLPPLEAMASGRPVISSNTSSLPEVVGDVGIQVSPTSIPEIAEAMIFLKEHSIRQSLYEKGISRARGFSWDKSREETMRVLNG